MGFKSGLFALVLMSILAITSIPAAQVNETVNESYKISLSLDKAIYHPGEEVHLTGYLLDS